MKRNKRYTVIAILLLGLGWGMVSCNTEPVPDPNPVPQNPTEKAYFSFKLIAPPTTRATTEPGEKEERIVESIWMLLYDSDSENLEYAYNLKATNISSTIVVPFYGDDVAPGSDSWDAPSTDGFVCRAKEVQSKPYKLVVIANPGEYYGNPSNGYMTDFTNGKYTDGVFVYYTSQEQIAAADLTENKFYTLSSLQAVNGDTNLPAVTGKEFFFSQTGSSPNYSYSNFFMSNANGVITVDTNMLKASDTEAQAAPVRVNLDRAVAKIIVNEKEEGAVVTHGGEITSFTWALQHVNLKTYLIRKFAPLYNATGNRQGTMETAAHENREIAYATDPNFTVTASGDLEKNFADEAYADFIPWNAAEDNIVTEKHWKYTLENTMDLAAQQGTEWMNYTTHIVFYVNISYPNLGSDDYYSYNVGTTEAPDWKVFTLAQVKLWRASSYPPDMEELKTVAGEGMTAGTSSFFNKSNPDDLVEPTIPQANQTKGQTIVEDESAEKKVAFHENGFNIYTLPIRHFNFDGTSPQTYGYYGVVRNNVYRIRLTQIHAPGQPATEGDWLSADITVNSWYARTQEEEVKHE